MVNLKSFIPIFFGLLFTYAIGCAPAVAETTSLKTGSSVSTAAGEKALHHKKHQDNNSNRVTLQSLNLRDRATLVMQQLRTGGIK